MTKETNNDDRSKQIMSAQFRNQASIAYFNALNAAITITNAMSHDSNEVQQEHIVYWRDWLIAEYMEYHNTTIENITPESIDVNDAIKRIMACESVSEIRRIAGGMPDSVRNDEKFVTSAREHIKLIKVENPLPVIE